MRVEHRDPNALPSRGPSNALVTIELFFTPGMGSRASGYSMVEKLQANHPSRIHLIYRIIQGNGSARLHYAALEAHAQGKFFEFMDALHAKLLDEPPAIPDRWQLLELCRKIGHGSATPRARDQQATRRVHKAAGSQRAPQATQDPQRAAAECAVQRQAARSPPPTAVSLAVLEAEYEKARDEAFDD